MVSSNKDPTTMKSLSGLDATFLYLETPETPMHVGSLNLYELPAGFKGSFHKAVKQHIGKRMHLAPIFSRQLAFMPFDLGHPMWVEAEKVDLDFHIRKVTGKQLTVRQAEAMAAKLHGQLIDREHPLWEFYVFDDIKAPASMAVQGKLVGFYSKIHHAALDGKGGTVLANAVLDLSAEPRQVAPPDASRKGRTAADLKIGEMIGAVFSNSLAQYAKLARSLPTAATSLGTTVARQSFSGGDKGITSIRPKSPISLAPKTIFNVGITRERAFATATIPFAESKAMAKAVGGSFNDIILWICATALRNYLARHATLPKKPLVAAMPVSLREESNKEMNNQASISVVDLGTHLADPLKRLNAIMASTAKVKEALVDLKSVLPTDYPSLLSPWVMGGAARALFKTYGKSGIADKLPTVANVAISNVPGPQVPLYLAGARMVTFHPLSIVMHGLALNITIQTYAGRVDFGIVADKKAVPHLQDLADDLEAAFEEAKGLFAAAPVVAPVKSVRKKRAAPAKSKPRAGRRRIAA
jgi:diacylglycerol O-acyltransferase / wax synthase